ncbi:molybdopterin molybdotransferase MoeA [Solilutibacter silvestris]|uniref:Molybdopterin molybdenumtransferase n=1 Tax=Solilutibacter silvestris TaxID=1645665 RepID=A0A2K1Q350_9GAMM|nr:molybdopterin molybdotransferase MoeA [Lysobacter silvestris]PNS09479.1 molybdenum cofactor synthesis domain-containing protein [Lysobacter silvestris]
MSGLLHVDAADVAIARHMPRYDAVSVPLAEAAGRILRQPIHAGHDHPPFDRVMMDGIAVHWCEPLPRAFAIAGQQFAGTTGTTLDANRDSCIEIATGAMLPDGCDCVIPIEQLRREGGRYLLMDDCQPRRGQFVHPRGSDCVAGSELLETGMRLGAPEMAVLASNGFANVEVAATPSIAILSTGDELLAVDAQEQQAGSIRRSNDIAIATALRLHGFDRVVCEHVGDDRVETEAMIGRLLAAHDVLILSGGVSKGQRDHVPAALQAHGVERVFHGIAQRPGKPMWFGIGPRGQAVFALPGNPVSALVCTIRYVRPALLAAQGASRSLSGSAVLAEAVETSDTLTIFVPARLHIDGDGRQIATAVPTRTSGDFTALPRSDCVVELPVAGTRLPAGHVVAFHEW